MFRTAQEVSLNFFPMTGELRPKVIYNDHIKLRGTNWIRIQSFLGTPVSTESVGAGAGWRAAVSLAATMSLSHTESCAGSLSLTPAQVDSIRQQ